MSDASFCPTTAYAVNVVKGIIIAGKSVQQACERHINDLERSYTSDYEYEFSRKKAQKIYSFFDKFVRHTKGELAGKAVKLELWQKFILGSLIGWISKETGYRRFELSYTQIARKNGKSLLSSGLTLYMLTADGEKGAECYCASVKQAAAKIVFDDSLKMLLKSYPLRKRARVQKSLSTITFGDSVLKALSADKNQDGLNIHFVSYDEFHLEKDRAMYDVLISAFGARKQPLMFIITTAGESRGLTSPCYKQYEYSLQVLNGTVENENVFCFIAEMDKNDDIGDPKNWVKSNPNIDVSTSLESLKKAYARAVQNDELDNFTIKHMNRWIDKKDAYFPVSKLGEKEIPDLVGKECYIGVDLSSTTDLTAVNAVFPLDDGEYAVLSHCFTPDASLDDRARRDGVNYRKWAREGYLTIIPEVVIDQDYVYKLIEEWRTKYEIISVALDPWSASALMLKLDKEGYETVEVRQGVRTLSAPIKFTKDLMLMDKLNHLNNPLLKWNFGNAIVKKDANENVVLDKSKSINRIDAAAATINAMVEAMLHGQETSLDAHINEDYSIW